MKILKIAFFVLLFAISFYVSYLYKLAQSSSSAFKIENYQAVVVSSPTPEPGKNVRVIATGDVMLGRSVMIESLDRNDPFWPFKNVSDTLRGADITFINLENPIVKDCLPHVGGFTFCTIYEIAEGLTFAGVDVVTLANNHSLNYGQKGLEETISFLEDKGIEVTGVGRLATRRVNETTFGFLGFDKSQQTQPKLDKEETALIRESDKKVDVLIIGMHWGTEYQDKALPGVRTLAAELVKNGADVVVGHHPHWVQDYEIIEGVPVYYSLGNFIFDQMWSEETKQGMMVELTFKDGKFVKDALIKTYVRNLGQPEIVD